MFATLLGALPRPDATDDTDIEALIVTAVLAQEAAGLEPVTDGRLRDPLFERLSALVATGRPEGAARASEEVLGAWAATARLTARAVKQALPGPYTIGWRLPPGDGDREAATLAAAGALAAAIDALAEAGCPLVEIEESEAHRIGTDEDERRLFRDAHRRLSEGAVPGAGREDSPIHLSLSIVGEAAAAAGHETILAPAYASYAFDLIAGPDNWNLATRVPRDRGVIAGVLSARRTHEAKEIMLWAAHRIAAAGGRGMDRVGLGSAGSFANLTWEAAVEKLQRLGEASRLASMPPSEELARSLDPRSVSCRRAALGHDAPRPRRSPRRRR